MATDPRLPWLPPSGSYPLRPLVVRVLALGLLLAGGIMAMAMMPRYPVADLPSYAAIHTILETFAVVVAMLIFATGWTTAGRCQPASSVHLAGAFLSVGLLDLLHMVSYAGMPPLVTPAGAEKAINFWLAARFVSAVALLQFVISWRERPSSRRLRAVVLAANLGFVSLAAWVGLWHSEWLPRTFIEGVGLTRLKITLEYTIAGLFLYAACILLVRRQLPGPFSVSSLLLGLVTLVASELCFTLYFAVNDGFNLLGHVYKVAAYLFLYHALFVGTVKAPYLQLALLHDRLAGEHAKLQVSEARFRALDTSLEERIFTLDREGRYTDVFGRWLERAKLTAADFIGRTSREILGPEAAAVHEAAYARALAGEPVLYEWTSPGSDGLAIYQTSLAPLRGLDGQITGVIGLGREVTEQRRAEAALALRNRELALLNRVIAASAESVSPEAILATVCRELAMALESSRAVAVLVTAPGGHAHIVATYPEVAALPPQGELDDLLGRVRAARGPLLQAQGGAHQLVLPVIVAPDRAEVAGMVALTSPEPWPPEAVALAERVILHAAGALARAQLTQAHQLLSTAQEQVGESTMITDADGVILAVNPAFERVSGYRQAEVLGKTPRLLKSGHHDDGFYQQLWATLRRSEIWRGRLVNRHKDGSLYTVETTIVPLDNADGVLTHYVAVSRDMTREIQLEAQVRQSQKMEAVGRLAGGIAHDFNNLLSVINGYSELLLQAHTDPGDPARRDAEAILHAGERAAALTRQLLAFSRRQPLQAQVLSMNAILVETEKLLRRLIGEDITVVLRLDPELWLVAVDRGLLEQVVMNLAVNARDAMPKGGTLTMATRNVGRDEAPGEGDRVRLEVRDTGVGMRAETLEHLFEPFYTTKAPGHGTGLGLATVYGIITQSGGTISVESAPGQGAHFIIDLPRHVDEAALAQPDPGPEPLPRGAGTILLVEDEAPIRALGARVLEGQGYAVLVAHTAAEALRQHAAGTSIDLLLTDVVLTDTSGVDLAYQLRRAQPELRVLLMSGYPDRLPGGDLTAAPLLLKPFTPTLLVQAVRAALEQPVSAAGQWPEAPWAEPTLQTPDAAPARAGMAVDDEPTPAQIGLADERLAELRAANAALHWHLTAQAQALHAREAVFQILFQTATVGIALVDLDGSVIEANEADARLLGYTPDELRGMHLSQFTHPDDINLDAALFGELITGTRTSYAINKRYVRKDGAIVWGHLTVALLRDQDGEPHAVVVTCEDITARMAAEGDQAWWLTTEGAKDIL